MTPQQHEKPAEQLGAVIRTWTCPVSWHRYVKWHGADAYCIEPGCWHSNTEDRRESRR